MALSLVEKRMRRKQQYEESLREIMDQKRLVEILDPPLWLSDEQFAVQFKRWVLELRRYEDAVQEYEDSVKR